MKPTKAIFIALLISLNGFCQSDTVRVVSMPIKPDCLKNRSECYDCIITSREKGKVFTADFKTKGDCIEYKNADSLFTIVGAVAFCGGCKPPEKFVEVIKIPSQKKYIFTFRLKPIGECLPNFAIDFWIMIPKVEPGYKMEYNFYDH